MCNLSVYSAGDEEVGHSILVRQQQKARRESQSEEKGENETLKENLTLKSMKLLKQRHEGKPINRKELIPNCLYLLSCTSRSSSII